ncbi:MAG: alpha/beta hydrolase [Polyangiales bacterium]
MLGLSLALWGCADEASVDDGSDIIAQQAAATTDYGKPGPYVVVEENNLGAGFATAGFDDTALCEIAVPTLTNGKATPEQLATFIKYPTTLNPRLHSIIRPQTLEPGKKYPVILWGNGTCAAPIYYRTLLNHLATHGFVVITPNSRQVNSGDLLKSLEVLTRLNSTRTSPYYQKLDLTRVGASGHAQGGVAAIIAAEDKRVRTILPIASSVLSEPLKPVLYLTGEKDAIVPYDLVKEAFDATEAPKVFVLSKLADHVSPIQEAFLLHAPMAAWFRAELLNEPEARAFFRGPSCTLCANPDYAVENKDLP